MQSFRFALIKSYVNVVLLNPKLKQVFCLGMAKTNQHYDKYIFFNF
jgi:hypothetical protein